MILQRQLIQKIIQANYLEQVLDVDEMDREFRKIYKIIHPDLCTDPQAHEAMIRLRDLKRKHIEGEIFKDDACQVRNHGTFMVFEGDHGAVQKSFRIYNSLMRLKDESSIHFQKYLPWQMNWTGHQLRVSFKHRVVPISGLQLPQHHVNWILSRLLEFSAWMAQIGYVHAGIHPESVFLVPETHGIVIGSFYHTTRINSKLESISGKYQNWYTPSVFTQKKAIPLIDTELAQKTAIYLLGDPSGVGIKLKKTQNRAFVDFVIAQHREPYQCFLDYRKMLKDNFEKKFYPLDL